MKICAINDKNRDVFSPFLPEEYRKAYLKKDYLGLGIYDDKKAVGAALLHFMGSGVRIENINYRRDVKPGVCEGLVSGFIEKNAETWKIDNIEYVREGQERRLRDFDIIMYGLGYLARTGDVRRYVSTLGRIAQRQSKSLDIYNKKSHASSIIRADKIDRKYVIMYNMKHEAVPFSPEEITPQLSYFYIKNDEPVAVLMLRESKSEGIVLDWLDRDEGADPLSCMYLIYEAISRAMEEYGPDKRILVYPFREEIKELVKSFDFTEDKYNNRVTHIYTKEL